MDNPSSVLIDTILSTPTFEMENPLPIEKDYTIKMRGFNQEESIRGNWISPIIFSTKLILIPIAIESDENELEIPATFSLSQNYPNPFNPSTTIKIELAKESTVRLEVFNSLGQSVKILTNQMLRSGVYEYVFDASGLSSGMYFYRLQTEGFTETKKMLLLK